MATVLTTQFPVLTSGRTALPPALHQKLLELEVESTYNRPDLCLVTFDLDANTEIPPALELGQPFEIGFRGDAATTKVFEGEITALEFDSQDNRSVFIVQAECKFHRLFRTDRVRTWSKKTVSYAVRKVASDAGIPVGAVEATTSELPFQMQQNITDGDWLLERAAEHGFHVRVTEGKLFWGKVGAGGDSGVTLELNRHLMGFNCRATANAFAKEVTVRSWDTVQKKPIDVKATSFDGRKDDKVATAFDDPKLLLTRSSFGSPAEATAAAKAALDRANEHNLQAEGRCWGDAKLAVDKQVAIKGVNKRFDGKYRISHLRHRFTHEQGFTTEFSCRGVSDQSLSGLVGETAAGIAGAGAPDRAVFNGAAVGIVTDVKDPDGLGRVKVKFPWLDEKQTSDWLRIAFPGGGGKAHSGWYLLPEVEDEVLVVFEHGDVKRGYVLGGLHNGVDKPFYKNEKVIGGDGKVNQHAFRLKSGAHLLFDEKDGDELIEIKNKDGNFVFKHSAKDGVVLENKTSGDKMAITNKGNMTIVCETGDISIEAKQGGIKLKAMKDINLEATGKVGVKATQDASVEGMNVKVSGQMNAEVKGSMMAKLEGGTNATVKAAMVMIN